MRRFLRGCIRSKTMWFSAALVLLGALADSSTYIQGLLDEKSFNVLMISIGVISAILRILTVKPIDDK